MADLTITAASVLSSGSANIQHGRASEALTAGQAIYKVASTGKWALADSNSATAAAKTAGGIALNGAATDQPVAVQTHGDIVIGATLVAGSSYYLSETPGGIQPEADLGSGENVVLIGLAKSTTTLTINIQAPGVTL